MNHEESKIQAAIVSALSLLGIFLFAVGNDFAGATSAAKAGRLKAMGLRPGVSDLVIIGRDGKGYFLEIKTATGVLSSSQKNFRDLCSLRAWPYAIARSVDEAIDQCKKWDLTK